MLQLHVTATHRTLILKKGFLHKQAFFNLEAKYKMSDLWFWIDRLLHWPVKPQNIILFYFLLGKAKSLHVP